MMELYAASVYFTMQTLTTVGYGDIRIVQTEERVLCILLEFVGVIFFSFAAGSLTQLISNFDSENSANVEKDEVLNRILKEYHIPTDLYV
jgi:voltage-gated potassium channel Kch